MPEKAASRKRRPWPRAYWQRQRDLKLEYRVESTRPELIVVTDQLQARPARGDLILRQVDCLVALGRRAEAITLLEQNLDLDGWRGKLRRRLVELGWRPMRVVN